MCDCLGYRRLLGPAVSQISTEQGRLDDAFYATIQTATLSELSAEFPVLSGNMRDAKTWKEYSQARADLRRFEFKYQKAVRGVKRWKISGEAFDDLRMLEARISSINPIITGKMDELRAGPERFNPGDIKDVPGGKVASLGPLWPAFYTSWPFALLVLLVRLRACGFNPWLELSTPWWLTLATLAWPIGVFMYPTGNPGRQVMRSLRFAAFTLTTALSLTPAMAFAQSVKKDNGKKKDPHVLILDVRTSTPVGPEPNPDGLLKATLTTPSGWVFQTTEVVRPATDFWSATNLFGRRVVNKNGVRVDILGGYATNSTGARVVPAGMSLSVNRKGWLTAFPFIGYEKRLDKPVQDIYAVNQTLLKAGRWRLGLETYAKKVFHAPYQWYVGGVLGRALGKASYLEASVNRNQSGAYTARIRSSIALSW
ncbi:MAG: hypothetical protein A2566_02470 [Candidatus Zambryskibacteria bacterium RIFOXYD1_FULL_40_13]|nr:MAG: hypothetical protein UT25_C0001G0234 [Parcubacteria group bacterium GW2011_GWC1_39_12]KKR19758.1 MAG: hypothetical protein UT49_C0001G0234 [Parcubacteria group bacterium GW2011_GWF1_39_37]KKR34817.1 MAG: hypothetical protein UT68_C0008G0030 [Parcubacteria group bacterium GW2011_GWC2_40_10]KKR52726.1 MAG: hypothetical protein UT89_C0001G0234 [Parcubacteria group bacterium GW2011_GWE1_40_20]KKR69094.1 MAG: hypothetical protein UU11_C0003G0088 [Parcubacteria group bacterium GW2011_GWF2_40_